VPGSAGHFRYTKKAKRLIRLAKNLTGYFAALFDELPLGMT
jgi:hypothetical protein